MDITKACRNVGELSPVAQKAIKLFLDECKKQGLAVLVTETYRSQERQNYLYEQGRTRPGNIVTNTKSSVHTKRHAWDVCKNVKGQEYSDEAFFKKCGAIAKTLGIEWGGTWTSFVDKPHFQVETNWKEPVGASLTILLNGKEKEVAYINKEGNNYIKLQDLRDDKIQVDYDSTKKMPVINVK